MAARCDGEGTSGGIAAISGAGAISWTATRPNLVAGAPRDEAGSGHPMRELALSNSDLTFAIGSVVPGYMNPTPIP